MAISLPSNQKKLQEFIDRRHPGYYSSINHWTFCRESYDGGRKWFEKNLFKYLREGENEFRDRRDRAYRFNHTREVVHLVTKYIFKSDVVRNVEDAPEAVKRFWADATSKRQGIDEIMRRVSDLSSIYGRVWVGVDSDVPGPNMTRRDEKTGAAKIYMYLITPENMLDYSWDDVGGLRWVKYRVTYRDDVDPVGSSGQVMCRYMIWTTEEWLYLEDNGLMGDKRKVTIIDRGPNEIGVVPMFPVDEFESDDPYSVPALIGDIAYLDRAVTNYLSNLDAIIQDQTFSQLTIPSQGLMPGDDDYSKLVEAGTKRLFVYDGESGGKPEFISPDPKQAGVILDVVNKIISEIYHSVGMAGERTKQDNSMGIDNSSGVAKAYDFERVNSLLASKADVLERAEDRIVELVALWAGEALKKSPDNNGLPMELVKYPDTFDVRGLNEEFEIADRLSLLSAPDEIRQQQMLGLVTKLFPRQGQAVQDKMEAAIKKWPPEPVDPATGAPTGSGSGLQARAGSSLRTSRQGQVTDKTKKPTPSKTSQG